MSAHTPGPWEMECVRTGGSNGAAGAFVYFKLEAEDVTVAGTSVYVGKTNGATRKIPEAECEANARLIAAAPELLSACERAYDLMGDLGPLPASQRLQLLGVMTDIAAVIAKARGGK